MKRFLLYVVPIATVLVAVATAADPPLDQPSKITPLMHLKLDKSKAILEGLTLEQFDTIKINARALRLLSTESGWNVLQTKEYAAQSRDFQRAADLVIEAADDKDIHRATLGYVALTVRCVECHSYMRKHRVEFMKLDVE
ncbi:hypothetical protein Pla22_48050 [Rubripirellula amarantea]|uniref:Cytochrome C n=1 Tax=Rubripirellula amarantea TaxID=2527999 RepID=A0A5C5WFS5_9BACT|nr:hypothetical protein [Rubripirellula amarantea]TWT49608.1 hypothetical protein Pla22_48050 [Rubripirellula amarantea]